MSAPSPAARGRILVVEDDPEAALFAVYVLANRGQFEVTHTADPAVALRLAAEQPWDLVLTDMQLPVMTGLELLQALRQVAPGLPVAVMTADAAGASRTAASRGAASHGAGSHGAGSHGAGSHGAGSHGAGSHGGADEYLEKPLGVDQLISAATALISRGRAARRNVS